jgi:predicted amidohydrolase
MRRISFWFLILTILWAACTWSAAAEDSSPNKIVRVVTISEALLRHSDDLLDQAMARLDQAAEFQPDIVCLPELFTALSIDGPAEPIPGPTSDRLTKWAAKHSSYVVFGMKRKAGGRISNSAILIDRKGQIVGVYDKIYPTELELKAGTAPANVADPPVFEADFGKVGMLICFDVDWWNLWERLKEKGAQIVFWPSAFPATRQLTALALKNQYYIVSSTDRGTAAIYDITGSILASSGEYQQWAGAALPIGKRLFEVDFNLEAISKAQKKYGSRIQVVWFHDDDWFTLASLDPHLTVEDLISEFGLVPQDRYHLRTTTAIDAARINAQRADGDDK